MHGDEANQAMKTGVLLEEGTYVYDPHEHHGPTLYYFSLPILWLNGATTVQDITEPMLRILPACFGLGLVLLSWFLVAPIDRRAAFWAALLTAISHGLTYYSRYYVQEISFVFFAGALLLCAYHYLDTRKLGWALGTGFFLGLLHATKETSVLVVLAMVGALAVVLLWERFVADRPPGFSVNKIHLAAAFISAVFVSIVLFSSFFGHWRGPLDSLLTYGSYLHRSEGQGSSAVHDHPWYYYFSLLAWTYREAGPKWSEGLILVLGLMGGVWWLWRPWGGGTSGTSTSDDSDPKSLKQTIGCESTEKFSSTGIASLTDKTIQRNGICCRFLIVYFLLLSIGFSIIPYKTPWNLLIFLHPLCLLAGLGAQRLIAVAPWKPLRVALIILLLAGCGQLTQQTWRGIFTYSADVRNPYVYAHTSTAIRRLEERVAAIAAVHPQGKEVHINVFRFDGDYWPLPWYLRAYPNVGYWPNFPENCDADIILTSPEIAPALQPQLKQEYQFEMNALRPGILMPTFIRRELWDAFMVERQNKPAD